jgi:hypothetical protein
MKLLKQALAVLGTVVVIAVFAALVTPKTAHAIVATLVDVVNTTANPAITQDTSKQASQIVTLYCPSTASLMPCYQLDEQGVLSTIQYSVPSTGHYVITGIDFAPNGFGTGGADLALTNNYDTTHTYYFIQINNVANFNITQLSFIGLVMGPTTKPAIANQVGFSEGSIWLHGYLTAN